MIATATTFLQFTQSTPAVHAGIEWAAYFVGGRVYFWRPAPNGPALHGQNLLFVLACTVFCAAAAAIALHDLESFNWLWGRSPTSYISGKSLLGGLLGGTMGTELAKMAIGWHRSTGDRWVLPLVVGISIGRIGCQLSGTWDMTYGSPTGTRFGWDYGDGVPRYPTSMFEIIAVVTLWLSIRSRTWSRPGQRFNAFLLGYCAIRLGLEFLKPPFGAGAIGSIPVDLFLGLTAIQWTAIGGAAWMTYRMQIPTDLQA